MFTRVNKKVDTSCSDEDEFATNIENLFIAKLFSLISLVFFATFSYSHEMWLEANSFQIDTNDVLEVNIKIGEKLQGSNLPYIPKSIEEFYWSQNGENQFRGRPVGRS